GPDSPAYESSEFRVPSSEGLTTRNSEPGTRNPSFVEEPDDAADAGFATLPAPGERAQRQAAAEHPRQVAGQVLDQRDVGLRGGHVRVLQPGARQRLLDRLARL